MNDYNRDVYHVKHQDLLDSDENDPYAYLADLFLTHITDENEDPFKFLNVNDLIKKIRTISWLLSVRIKEYLFKYKISLLHIGITLKHLTNEEIKELPISDNGIYFFKCNNFYDDGDKREPQAHQEVTTFHHVHINNLTVSIPDDLQSLQKEDIVVKQNSIKIVYKYPDLRFLFCDFQKCVYNMQRPITLDYDLLDPTPECTGSYCAVSFGARKKRTAHQSTGVNKKQAEENDIITKDRRR